MAAPDVGLGNAIVADVNDGARAWPLTLTAERTYIPIWIGEDGLDADDDLKCLINVWPLAEVEPFERKATRSSYSFDFGFGKRLDNAVVADLDNIREVVDLAFER